MSRARRFLVGELHRRGIYRLGKEPFGAIDRPRLFRRFEINVVFDVGANVGGWAKQLRDFGYTGRIISLEPASGPFATLASTARDDPLWYAHQLAAGDADETASFHIASNAVSSSLLGTTDLFTEQHPGVLVIRDESVSVCRLDMFATDVAVDSHPWVKLDVEGSELAAIAGAKDLLGRTDVVEVELATERLYEGAPLFYEVAPALYELGFVLIAVASAFTAPSGRTVLFDAVFVRLQ
jgi:FkbM family methyltransferase